jgi:catechol 2,3-dioxygenase-like lactoylglutathione lyase family enzyme
MLLDNDGGPLITDAMGTAVTTGSVHHIGIPVRDLDRSLEFYKGLAGVVDPESIIEFDVWGEALSAHVGLPDAEIRIAFLPVGNNNIELLQYRNPIGRATERANCDIGSVHVCFEVGDIAAAYEELTAQGVEFSAPPFTYGPEYGAIEGFTFAYFRDPDGTQLELLQLPPD